MFNSSNDIVCLWVLFINIVEQVLQFIFNMNNKDKRLLISLIETNDGWDIIP